MYLFLSKKTSLKKAREDGMTNKLLIIDEWDIAVDDNQVNSLDPNINNVKKLDYQMMIMMIIVMNQISVS